MPQSFASLHFHIVFSTKNRQQMIGAEFKDEFKSLLIRHEIVFDEKYLWD